MSNSYFFLHRLCRPRHFDVVENCIASSLRNIAESIAIPCSVNTYGSYLLPPLDEAFSDFIFEVAIRDLKEILHQYVTLCQSVSTSIDKSQVIPLS
jgi:hypothetical protein